jgi:DNA-binding PadR family transcriptional regulator
MPKPVGTCGATKMKILAIMSIDYSNGQDSYGYDIWQRLKDNFYTYMDDNDVRNVYHHLNDLCSLGYIAKRGEDEERPKCYYTLTPMADDLRQRYMRFLDILQGSAAEAPKGSA